MHNELIYSQKECLSANKYLFNGKELQNNLLGGINLDFYDYSKRFMDPQIGRFTTVDRDAENYFPISVYAYVSNNPIIYIDPDGKRIVDAKGNIIYTQSQGWSKNASEGAIRIGNAMMKTQVGREIFNIMVDASYSVTLTLKSGISENKDLGTMDPTYDKYDKNKLIWADIVIYEGNLKTEIDKFKSLKKTLENNPNAKPLLTIKQSALLENLPTVEERIGQVGVHEGEHVTNKQAQSKFNPDKENRETIANRREIQAIKQTPGSRLKKKEGADEYTK